MRFVLMVVHIVLLTLVAATLVTAHNCNPFIGPNPFIDTSPAIHRSFSTFFERMCLIDKRIEATTHTALSLLKDVKNLLKNVDQTLKKSEPRHCKDLLDAGDKHNGLRVIHPYPEQPARRLTVYCDQTTDGGGWTVFQRRTNCTVREDFYRTWVEYELGFGNKELEFWLGLDPIHALTSTALQELRIDLADWEGHYRYAKYGFFYVGDAESKYLLLAGRYSGNAGNAIEVGKHSGMKFSTFDADNDEFGENCAKRHSGAWWYYRCHRANLNGFQYKGKHASYANGINWKDWKGLHYSLRQSSMMIRPAGSDRSSNPLVRC